MSAILCSQIKQQAARFRAEKKWYRVLSQRAAVCIIVADRPGLGASLLMIQRAEREGDPWSGNMAFPGGKHDLEDAHITATATRECREELGLETPYLHRFGRMSDILARPYRLQQKPMVVSPILFEYEGELLFQPNEEVADVLWVPLAHFLQKHNRQSMIWQRGGIQRRLPCYFYREKRIWGLTLLMIDELTGLIGEPHTGR